jgi:putative transposase
VWQRGFTDHRIRDAADMEARRAYLHMNPVRGRLVEAAELYLYSSAYRPAKLTSGAEAPSLPEPLRHG